MFSIFLVIYNVFVEFIIQNEKKKKSFGIKITIIQLNAIAFTSQEIQFYRSNIMCDEFDFLNSNE